MSSLTCSSKALTIMTVFFITNCVAIMSSGLSTAEKVNCSIDDVKSNSHKQAARVEVAGWHWEKLSTHIAVSIFIVAICIMKIGYHKVPHKCKIITASIPESNILIIVGVISGIIVYFIKGSEYKTMHWSLNPDLFFFILLPPIMLESAYSLYDRNFLNNLSTIIYFAVVGTVLNCLIIGFSMYAISLSPAMGEPKLNLTIDNSLLFGSIVVAVDPVAVLAIFNEIGVQPDLYYTVFGESLFNDAVTVVLYNMFNAFTAMETKTPVDVVLGLISFFTVSFGGLFIGIIVGALCSFISRFTENSRIMEPMMIFTTALLSYYLADLVGWSGIMSIISCGIVQAAYCFDNISRKSKTTVKYFSKVMASVSEGIIFLFLGLELVTNSHYWHWGFALWSLTLCIVARFLVVFISSIIRNIQLQEKATKYGEMFIIAFGGLRGAVAFALAATLNKEELLKSGVEKDLYVTTSLFIIMFTCFVMGLLMKPAVRLMKISITKNEHQLSVFYEFNNHVMDHISTAMDDVIGRKGNNYFRTKIEHFSENFIRPLLQRQVHRHAENIIDIYHKVALEIHLATVELTTTETDKKNRNRITEKLTENLKKQIDDFKGSPEEFQRLTHPNYSSDDLEKTPLVKPIDGKVQAEMSIKKLRAAFKVITLASPTRHMKTATYHDRISRSQQNDDDDDGLAEQIEQLHQKTLQDVQLKNIESSKRWGHVRDSFVKSADRQPGSSFRNAVKDKMAAVNNAEKDAKSNEKPLRPPSSFRNAVQIQMATAKEKTNDETSFV